MAELKSETVCCAMSCDQRIGNSARQSNIMAAAKRARFHDLQRQVQRAVRLRIAFNERANGHPPATIPPCIIVHIHTFGMRLAIRMRTACRCTHDTFPYSYKSERARLCVYTDDRLIANRIEEDEIISRIVALDTVLKKS